MVQTCAWSVEKHKNFKDMATFVFKKFAEKYVQDISSFIILAFARHSWRPLVGTLQLIAISYNLPKPGTVTAVSSATNAVIGQPGS